MCDNFNQTSSNHSCQNLVTNAGDYSTHSDLNSDSYDFMSHSLDCDGSFEGSSTAAEFDTASSLTLLSGPPGAGIKGKTVMTSVAEVAEVTVEQGRSNIVQGFFFMNSFCLLNTCAALAFKLLMKEGISILVLCLFRNISLLLFSLLGALTMQRGCLK